MTRHVLTCLLALFLGVPLGCSNQTFGPTPKQCSLNAATCYTWQNSAGSRSASHEATSGGGKGRKIITKHSGKVSGDTIKGKVEFDSDGQTQSRDWEAKRSND